jgi:hypothetical protein
VSGFEQELVQLGRALAVPEPPDFAPRVLADIGAQNPVRRTRQLVAALAALAVAALVAALAIPDARSALLRFLQIGGARIELVDELPAVAPDTAELEFTLGQRVSLAEARQRSAFALLELDEEPDAVYLGERDTVWFLYGSPGGVRLLIAQTPKVALDEPFIIKKLAGAGTSVEPATVRGEPAYFLSGEPHAVMFVDEYGVAIVESARLARDVLVWEEDGRTVRLEGDLTRAEALELADSLR